MSFRVRTLAILAAALLVGALLPKLRVTGLSTNTWMGGVNYDVRDFPSEQGRISGRLHCRHHRPFEWASYYEGEFVTNNPVHAASKRQIESLCDSLPTDLLRQGLPPRILAPSVKAPLFWGRII